MWKKKKSQAKTSRSVLVNRLDRVFSDYIRLRDSFLTQYGLCFRCISCGKIKPYDEGDCGHYINRGHMSTRFDEDNCNAQCRYCNRFDEGNIYNYRRGLVEKIGESRVLVLESKKNETVKITDFELTVLINHYRTRVKDLKKARE